MSLVWGKPCQKISLDAIQKATDNFHESKIIGKGGFGKVYKGVIDDGSIVAVKRLNPESKQGVTEFNTEINTLSKCRHHHLVTLVGYCDENHEMILVYEYMSQGTLADHLYKNVQGPCLKWEQRLNICIGAARGLDYLHTGISNKVIHLDVKSANILLDENWGAKIADLGLSRTRPENQQHSEVITDHVRGTRGYIDPQYLKSHTFTRKADVYAFGVVLIEVLTGTRATPMDAEPIDLANWIQQHIRNRTLNHIADKRVVKEMELGCLQTFAYIASKCLQNDPHKRPSMSMVVAELESALASQLGTNPSSTVVESNPSQYRSNAVHLTSENVSVGGENSSEHHGSSTESEAQASMDSDDSAIWSSMGISMAEYLGKTRNIFGEPIRNHTLVPMRLNPTRKNKALVAYNNMNLNNKYDNALNFVKHLKANYGNGITALCLLYNATGETLTYATSCNWFGDIGASPYPPVILNGQWAAFLHTKTQWELSGSVAAVVYRCKYSDNAFCDRMIGWSIPWQRITYYNTAFCDINEVGYFEGAVWEEIYGRINSAGRESSVRWKDCYTRVTVESETSPIYKAILTHVDVVTKSV